MIFVVNDPTWIAKLNNDWYVWFLYGTSTSNDTQQQTYPEVVGIHVQFLGVQHAELCICASDVVHVLQGSVQSVQHHFAVSGDHWVPHDGSGIVQVAEVAKVPLRPWVHDKTPGGKNECGWNRIINV